MLVKQADVCFTLHGNPFGTAGNAAGDRGEKGENEGLTVPERMARNQAIIRGAPVLGRSLTAVGTSLVASGIAMSRKPVRAKQFSSVSHYARRENLRRQHPTDWRKRWAQERKTTRYYRKYSGPNITGSRRFANDPLQQKQYWEKKSASKQRRAALRRGVAGGALTTVGRALPAVGYAIVIGSYLEYDGYAGGMPTGVNTGMIKSDAEYLVDRQRAMYEYGRSQAAEAYAAYRALNMIYEAVV